MPYLAALPHLQQRVGGGVELCHFLLQSCFCTPHTDLLSVVHLAILSCFFHCDFGGKEEHSWFCFFLCTPFLFFEQPFFLLSLHGLSARLLFSKWACCIFLFSRIFGFHTCLWHVKVQDEGSLFAAVRGLHLIRTKVVVR